MAFSRSRRGRGGGHDLFWPGYVDVLSTLLMVVTFLLSIFMVAQFYISQESSGKDTVLRRLTRQIAELTNLLSLEKGQGKAMAGRAVGAAGEPLDAQIGQRAPDRTGRCRRRKGCAHLCACQGAGRQVVALQRGTGQGRPPQPAAAAVAPADGGLAGGHRRRRKQGQGKSGAHRGPGRPPQCRPGQAGAGAAALPFGFLRPAARASARPQGYSRRRRPLRVRVGGAVPIRPGNHDRRGARRDRPARDRHRRAGAQHSRAKSTGRCRSTATPTFAASPARSSPRTGSCPARARPRS